MAEAEEAAQAVVAELVASGAYEESDFAVLIEVLARKAGLELQAENVAVDDGLKPVAI